MCTCMVPSFLQVLVNRGLLYVDLGDYGNGLLDLMEAGKVTVGQFHNVIVMVMLCDLQKAGSDPAIFQAVGLCYHQ